MKEITTQSNATEMINPIPVVMKAFIQPFLWYVNPKAPIKRTKVNTANKMDISNTP